MKPAYILDNRDRLTTAIVRCTSYTDVIRSFGLEPSGKRIGLLKRLIEKYGLSVEHFGKKEGYGRFSRADLEVAAREATSIAGMMRRLGMNPRFGSAHGALRQRLADLGIDTNHFAGSAWARQIVSRRRKRPEEILRRKPKGSPKVRSYILRRALLELGRLEICAECTQGPEWKGKRLTLQIDHLDGDNLNDEPNNLRFLCPNCHSQTPTFGFKSRKDKQNG